MGRINQCAAAFACQQPGCSKIELRFARNGAVSDVTRGACCGTSSRCAPGRDRCRSSPPERGEVGQPGEVQQEQTGDRAKDPFLWPDPSGNGRKLAENASRRSGLHRREIPANKPNSVLASAWIAPRRSGVRVPLAPLGEPKQRRGLWVLITGSDGSSAARLWPALWPVTPDTGYSTFQCTASLCGFSRELSSILGTKWNTPYELPGSSHPSARAFPVRT